jgi:hypothetical protein
LLNVSYKIVSACIANRLQTVLSDLVSEDQKGFMKGRNINENIQLLYSTLSYTEKHRLPGLLLMVDFEKAFDSVSFSFIDKCLNVFNFGRDMKKWVQVFYTKIKSCSSINGAYSSWFDVYRGTRQGDPLSPYLFFICAEILSLMVKQNGSIKGVMIHEHELLISQYADDMTFYLDGSRQSFSACIATLKKFADIFGLKINFDKSTAVWIGSLKIHENA